MMSTSSRELVRCLLYFSNKFYATSLLPNDNISRHIYIWVDF